MAWIVESIIRSSVAKKMLMAVTGQLMILFTLFHVIGNSTIYFGWLNAYADHLQSLPPLVWLVRVVMLSAFSLHVFLGIQITLENRSAKEDRYAMRKSLRATFASKNMIWTGLLIAFFLLYHLLHFTIQVINPESSARDNMDSLGRPDVFGMVVLNFQNVLVSLSYVIAMIALLLHLFHGIQSSFQSLGLNNDRTFPVIEKAGALIALILFLGYVSMPILVFVGILG